MARNIAFPPFFTIISGKMRISINNAPQKRGALSSLCTREDQRHLEQVAIHQELELALLQLHQTLGNIQA